MLELELVNLGRPDNHPSGGCVGDFALQHQITVIAWPVCVGQLCGNCCYHISNVYVNINQVQVDYIS